MKTLERSISRAECIRIAFLKVDLFRVHVIPASEFTDIGFNRYGFIVEPANSRLLLKVVKAGDGPVRIEIV